MFDCVYKERDQQSWILIKVWLWLGWKDDLIFFAILWGDIKGTDFVRSVGPTGL